MGSRHSDFTDSNEKSGKPDILVRPVGSTSAGIENGVLTGKENASQKRARLKDDCRIFHGKNGSIRTIANGSIIMSGRGG